MIRAALLVVMTLAALATPARAPATESRCRLALALGLDVSGSVDAREYRLQLDGLAAALLDPQVHAALFAMPGAPVRLAVYEWSDADYQTVLEDWTEIATPADLAALAARLRAATRRAAPPGTALGTAMQTGAALLSRQPECWRHVLDISGDGRNNVGPRPRDIRAGLDPARLTINALAIGADAPRSGDLRQTDIAELSAYFRAQVIMGSDSFVETALGFEDYQRAMTRKLLRELQVQVLGALPLSRAGAQRAALPWSPPRQ